MMGSGVKGSEPSYANNESTVFSSMNTGVQYASFHGKPAHAKNSNNIRRTNYSFDSQVAVTNTSGAISITPRGMGPQ